MTPLYEYLLNSMMDNAKKKSNFPFSMLSVTIERAIIFRVFVTICLLHFYCTPWINCERWAQTNRIVRPKSTSLDYRLKLESFRQIQNNFQFFKFVSIISLRAHLSSTMCSFISYGPNNWSLPFPHYRFLCFRTL